MGKEYNKDLISVIIPVYNVAPYLGRCLDSVITQTYDNLEIILVDDGSTDEGGHICDLYSEKDSRITVYHNTNHGLSAARNFGMKESHGVYILYLDSDDYISLSFVEKLYERLIETDADFVQCKIVHNIYASKCSGIKGTFNEAGNKAYNRLKRILFKEKTVAFERRAYDNNDYMRDVFLGKQYVSAWGKFFKRKIAEAVPMPEGRVYEDNAVIVLYAKESKTIANEPEAVYYYTSLRPGSITSTFSRKQLKDMLWAKKALTKDSLKYFPELREEALNCYRKVFPVMVKMTIKELPLRALLFPHTIPKKDGYLLVCLNKSRKKIRDNIKQYKNMPIKDYLIALSIAYVPILYIVYIKLKGVIGIA